MFENVNVGCVSDVSLQTVPCWRFGVWKNYFDSLVYYTQKQFFVFSFH